MKIKFACLNLIHRYCLAFMVWTSFAVIMFGCLVASCGCTNLLGKTLQNNLTSQPQPSSNSASVVNKSNPQTSIQHLLHQYAFKANNLVANQQTIHHLLNYLHHIIPQELTTTNWIYWTMLNSKTYFNTTKNVLVQPLTDDFQTLQKDLIFLQQKYQSDSQGFSMRPEWTNPDHTLLSNLVISGLKNPWPDFFSLQNQIAAAKPETLASLRKNIQHWQTVEPAFAAEQLALLNNDDPVSQVYSYGEKGAQTDNQLNILFNTYTNNFTNPNNPDHAFFQSTNFKYLGANIFLHNPSTANIMEYLYQDQTTNKVWALIDINGFLIWLQPHTQNPADDPRQPTFWSKTPTLEHCYLSLAFASDATYNNFLNPGGYADSVKHLTYWYQLSQINFAFHNTNGVLDGLTIQANINLYLYAVLINDKALNTRLTLTLTAPTLGNQSNNFSYPNGLAFQESITFDILHNILISGIDILNLELYRNLQTNPATNAHNATSFKISMKIRSPFVHTIFIFLTSSTFDGPTGQAAQAVFTNANLTTTGSIPKSGNTANQIKTPYEAIVRLGMNNFSQTPDLDPSVFNQMLPLLATNACPPILPTPVNPPVPPFTPINPSIATNSFIKFDLSKTIGLSSMVAAIAALVMFRLLFRRARPRTWWARCQTHLQKLHKKHYNKNRILKLSQKTPRLIKNG